MRTSLRKMGNSHGVIIPKAVIAQFGFEAEVEMRITGTGIILEKPAHCARDGWADASRRLAEAGDDGLVWPEFSNDEDEALTW